MGIEELKQHIVQELVPGKQITLAHLIANPDRILFDKIGMAGQPRSAIGVVTVTPAETAIILADIAIKASGVALGYLDCRENGSLIVSGTVSEVEASLHAILSYAAGTLRYEICEMTRT
ncbi:MAG: BMC domain-containing protein [Gemmiger sp.]|nr:BMC domain-containing protein [Gemmiger sp.]